MQSVVISPVLNQATSLPGAAVISSSGKPTLTEVRSALPIQIRKRPQESIRLIPHFKQFLAYLIAHDMDEVRAILMGDEETFLRVYIVVQCFDFDVNERIYDKEERIMDVFGDLNFDFQIITQSRISDPGLKVVFSR